MEYAVVIEKWMEEAEVVFFNNKEEAKAFAKKKIKEEYVEEVTVLDEKEKVVAHY